MNIRVPSNLLIKYLKLFNNSKINKGLVSITEDNIIKEPIIMTETGDGGYVNILEGRKNVENFIKNDGIYIIKKYCPIIRKTCKGKKCQFFIEQGITGDCVFNWNFLGR